MEDLTEAELLQRTRARDRATRDAAFEEIHRRLERGLEIVCHRMLGGRNDAEDAVQETFLARHHAFPSFRGDSKLSTYAYRIAVRVALRKRARSHKDRHQALTDEPGARSTDATHEREMTDAFDAAVASLRPTYRSVFSLCCTDELDQSAVARILGIPEGTVWTRLHRARKELATKLARWLE